MAKNRDNTHSEADAKRRVDKQGLRQLMGIYKFMVPYRWKFFAGLVCLVFSSGGSLAFPELMGQLIDAAKGELPANAWGKTMGDISLILVAILLVQSAFSFLRIYLFALVNEPAMADMRKALYQKFMGLPMSFYDSRRTGELMSRISSDVSTLHDTFSVSLAELIRQIIILIAGIAMLFLKTPELTIFMLLTIPVLVIISMIFGKFIRKLSKQTQDALANTNIIVEETLQAVPMVKSFANELYETLRYGKAMQETVTMSIRTALYRGAFVSFIIFALFSGIVAVVWYGTTLVSSGAISVGTLMAFVMYTLFIGGSVAGLGNIYGDIQRAIGSSERILEILYLPSEGESEGKEAIQGGRFQGNIEVKDLRFSYPTRADVEVLKGLSFHIAPGEKVAIVGHSGAGKSTIVQLLLRFYQWTDGQVYIDGKDATSYDLLAYRQNIGIVPQEVILFGGTIRENIAYGKPDASDEEIIEAAKLANAWQFIQSFPEGLATIVGERGVKLSGGQRQRVAIARAILKNPSILLLDEATSSLDAESEQLVQQALDKLMEGRTSIIIAHRLSTIRSADRIYVIDGGQVVEQGTHDELLLLGKGIYSNLVKLQFDTNKV